MSARANTSGSSTASGTAKAAPMSYNHMAWAAGHAVVALCTVYTLFKLVTFGQPSKYVYSIAYMGAMTAWGIVCYKTLGYPVLNRAYFEKLALDENGEYLALAFLWWLNKPVYISLLPFASFSLFHTLTFVRTTFLPPATRSAGANGQPQAPNLSKMIQTWVKKNYEPAMSFVAYTEVLLVMPYVILGALVRRNSFVLPLAYFVFLRLRFYLSPQTRRAFGYLNGQIDAGINRPSCPAIVKNIVVQARAVIVRYAQNTIAPGATPQPANAR